MSSKIHQYLEWTKIFHNKWLIIEQTLYSHKKSTQWCNRINTERNTKRTSGGPTKVAEMAPEKMNEHEHALTY